MKTFNIVQYVFIRIIIIISYKSRQDFFDVEVELSSYFDFMTAYTFYFKKVRNFGFAAGFRFCAHYTNRKKIADLL